MLRMKDVVRIVIHLAVTAAKLLGPGVMRAVVAENVPFKQQPTFSPIC